jgi:hypothetical protein
MDPNDPSPPGPPPTTPLGLEYFAADAPERRESRAVLRALGVVAVSLLPFACGVINVFVAAQSYSATVTGAHRGGAALFLLAGLLIGVIGMLRLLALRNTPGIAIGLLVLGLELVVVSCMGIAVIWG